MNVRFLLLSAALPVVLLGAAACGGDAGSSTLDSARTIAAKTPPSSVTPDTPTPKPTIDPNSLGPAPVLGGNVVSITPEHGAEVKQAATHSPNPNQPGGICANVTFDGLAENAQWFRMAFDGEEVTQKLTWIVTTKVAPEGGRVCYAPAEGFTEGRHSVALAVQDPRNPQVATRQMVAWKFDVIP